jgi:hypothetical protein
MANCASNQIFKVVCNLDLLVYNVERKVYDLDDEFTGIFYLCLIHFDLHVSFNFSFEWWNLTLKALTLALTFFLLLILGVY